MTESHTAPLNSPETTSNNPTSKSVALHLYKNGTISLGKAGEILGLSKQEMLHLLSIRRIPINYTTDDLETLDRVIG
jgi:predicted HTH domain antitoxin